jgi:hypothetical protein
VAVKSGREPLEKFRGSFLADDSNGGLQHAAMGLERESDEISKRSEWNFLAGFLEIEENRTNFRRKRRKPIKIEIFCQAF